MTRIFELEDDAAPQSLAAVLAWVAESEGVRPRLVLEGNELRVELASLSPRSRAAFARTVDAKLESLSRWTGSDNPRPAAALARLWGEAQDGWEAAVRRLSARDMERPTHAGAKETIFTEAVRHPLSAGFGYLGWIRHVRNLPDTRPPFTPAQVREFTDREQVLDALPALRADMEATLGRITEGMLGDRSHLASWGEAYSVEQILEHGIVHLLRHRLQIERYLAEKETPAEGQ
jgi:hypothetical protein